MTSKERQRFIILMFNLPTLIKKKKLNCHLEVFWIIENFLYIYVISVTQMILYDLWVLSNLLENKKTWYIYYILNFDFVPSI